MDDLTVAHREAAETWATAPKFSVNPVDLNFDAGHIYGVLAPCGLSVVVVENLECEKFWSYPNYPRDIGSMLIRLGLGRYAGSKYHPNIVHCFHVNTRKLTECMGMIADAVRVRGLAEQSQVIYACPEDRTWKAFTAAAP